MILKAAMERRFRWLTFRLEWGRLYYEVDANGKTTVRWVWEETEDHQNER